MLDGMTNIKASEVLKELKDYTEDLPPYSPDEVAEALEMAIKALEQEDVIENIRAEIKQMDFDFGDYYDHTDRIREMVLEVVNKYKEGEADDE